MANIVFLKSLVEEGLSEREVFCRYNARMRETGGTFLKFVEVKKLIQENSEPTIQTVEYSSSEEDEEYLSESSEEEDDEEYVPSDDEDEDESESENESESESESEGTNNSGPHVTPAVLTFCHQTGELDEVYIQPLIDHTFSVTTYYGCKKEGDKNTASEAFHASAIDVDEHVSLLMQLVAIDCKPYTEIEFTVPFYPNISMTPDALKSKVHRNLLSRMIRTYLAHYVE